MSAIEIDEEAFAEGLAEARRTVEVTVRLSTDKPGQIGRVLDQYTALAEQAGLEVELKAPGYHQTFYGWEADRDDG